MTSDGAKASEIEKRNRQKQIEKMVEDEKLRTNDIIADMTRQYKATYEDLVQRETVLATQIDQNEVEIKGLESEKEEITHKKKEIEEEKDLSI